MKHLRQIISCIVIFTTIFITSCSNPTPPENQKLEVYGIAIYYKLTSNEYYKTIKDKPSLINNFISQKENKINYNKEDNYLLYIYSQDEINQDNTNEYNSNTQFIEPKLDNNTINFTLEKFYEESEILIYLICKEENKYYLKHIYSTQTTNNKQDKFVLEFENSEYTKINLTLDYNLTINEKY